MGFGALSGGSELLVKPLRVGGDGGKGTPAGDIIPGRLRCGASLKGGGGHVLAGGTADVLAVVLGDAFLAAVALEDVLALGDM